MDSSESVTFKLSAMTWKLTAYFIEYLQQRAEELTGGKDNTEYKREDAVILQLIHNYKLDSGGEIPVFLDSLTR